MPEVDDPVIGKLGVVTHAIQPGRAGEVKVRIRGGSEVYMAVSETELAKGTEVVVVGQLSARTVSVMAFGPDPVLDQPRR